KTLNAIVDDGKADIQAFITQAKTDLTKVKDDATEEITTIANNSKSSVQDTASTSINAINATTTEATQHVDEKVTEFNQTVADNGFLSPEMLGEQLDELDWQKYQLTLNSGYLLFKSAPDLETMEDFTRTGSWYINQIKNSPGHQSGYITYKAQ